MTEIGWFDWTDKIRRHWEKPGFLIGTLLVVISTYFTLGKLVFEDDFKYYKPFVYITILIVMASLIIFWLLSTNRVFIKINKKDFTAILVLSENDKESDFVKSVIKKAIEQIKDERGAAPN